MKHDYQAQKELAYYVNTVIIFLVVGMMIIYHLIGAKLLVSYSILVTAVYALCFLFIYINKLRLFIWSTYTMLTIYMSVCTIMLGYNYGFHLYSMSTIPLIFYVKYISWKLKEKNPYPIFWTITIIISCLLSSVYTVRHGSYYHIDGLAPIIFLGINIASVCFFLFIFSIRMISLVIESENQLSQQANYDALTGLSNRYHLSTGIEKLLSEYNDNENLWLSIIDIDDFKKINDRYGHNTGDKVLKSLATIMSEICKECTVGRWGGEEFLICGRGSAVSSDTVEKLRCAVENHQIFSDDQEIHFTITAGIAEFQKGQSIDSWISNADNKLYQGKNNGKNQVVR